MSVRPPPSMTVVAPGTSAVGVGEIRSIRPPLTSTLDGGDSTPRLPSNTRTFRNSTEGADAVWASATAVNSAPTASASTSAITCAITPAVEPAFRVT